MSSSLSKRKKLLKQYGIDPENVPKHIAIIMDGNGRWAGKRGLARIRGHREAVKAVKAAIKACNDLGVKYLTLFAFSVDNWKRPRKEVDALMDLLREFLKKERKNLVENKVRFRIIGDIKALPDFVQVEIEKTLKATRKFTEHHFVLAVNYGGRADILHGVQECVSRCAAGEVDPSDITEEFFSSCLYTDGIPDPDLLIRTSGEHRISNFLLWQISYTEVWTTPVLWPDFRKDDLIEAVVGYSKRERRYGGR